MEIPSAHSIEQVCEKSQVSRSTIYRAIKAGELRAVKRGRRTLVLGQNLKQWLENLPAVVPDQPRAA